MRWSKALRKDKNFSKSDIDWLSSLCYLLRVALFISGSFDLLCHSQKEHVGSVEDDATLSNVESGLYNLGELGDAVEDILQTCLDRVVSKVERAIGQRESAIHVHSAVDVLARLCSAVCPEPPILGLLQARIYPFLEECVDEGPYVIFPGRANGDDRTGIARDGTV
jgi:hypothetical protein